MPPKKLSVFRDPGFVCQQKWAEILKKFIRGQINLFFRVYFVRDSSCGGTRWAEMLKKIYSRANEHIFRTYLVRELVCATTRKCDLHSKFSFFRARTNMEGKNRCVAAHDTSRPKIFSFLETFRSRFLYAKQTAHISDEKYYQIAADHSKAVAVDCQKSTIFKIKATVFQISGRS